MKSNLLVLLIVSTIYVDYSSMNPAEVEGARAAFQ